MNQKKKKITLSGYSVQVSLYLNDIYILLIDEE